VKVLELERDLGTATADLVTAGRQFSQVTNQLQVATEEAAQLHDNNAKLSQDLDGKSDSSPSPYSVRRLLLIGS
jgi:uncharacterized protein YoxC